LSIQLSLIFYLSHPISLPPKVKAEGKIKAKANKANGKRKNNAAQKPTSKKAKLSKT
jgi:hypothetical protein